MNAKDRTLTRSADAREKLRETPVVHPAVDIYENGDEVLLVADVPGVANDQVTIHFDKGQLTIEGRRAETVQGLAGGFDYRRTFAVPQGIDADKISAELTSGVLQLHLP